MGQPKRKKMHLKYLLLILTVICFLSCNKEEITSEPENNETETIIDAEGQTVLKIKNDNDQFMYFILKNDSTAELTHKAYYYHGPYVESQNSDEWLMGYITGEVVIPSVVSVSGHNYSVTSIGKMAFLGCSNVTSVTIPNTITIIKEYAFCRCAELAVIELPNSINTIEDYAFCLSGIQSITIHSPVSELLGHVFFRCDELLEVVLPKTLTNISEFALDCPKLINILVDPENNVYKTVDGVLFDYELTTLLQYPQGRQGAYTIPNTVISLSQYSFGGCQGLTSVVLPNSLKSIGREAFQGCTGLLSIDIPNSVLTINWYAFKDCDNLFEIFIPSSVSYIGKSAFGECDNLKTIIVDQDNDYYESIEGVLFTISGEDLIQYPAGKQDENYSVPNTVLDINSHAFSGCIRLKSVSIPNSVLKIRGHAFYGCSGLVSIEIPSSVELISTCAFYHCSGLTSATCKAINPPTINDPNTSIFNKNTLHELRVPQTSLTAYKTANGWSEYADIMVGI